MTDRDHARSLEDDTVGTIAVGGATVRRLGFGAMRVSGARNAQGVRDRDEAVRLYRRVYERGVNFIDVANIYGYGECEEILAEALYPYPADLLIGTKAGFEPGKIEPGKRSLPPLGRPEHIRAECDKSLRRLRLDHIDLYQVHVPDPDVPYEETVGAFVELQRAGKIRDIGISNVTLDHLATAQSLCEVVAVQNAYNVARRGSEPVLEACARQRIAFIPHSPNILGESPVGGVVRAVAEGRGVSVQQVAIAWLLGHSPVMVPIPGTANLAHADDNVDAAWLELSDTERARLDAAASD
ncbi:MAG TPA: aldo/keto reductase [Acidimicrobiales bacterium]|nr:aldo/keto reductase [Acidimicrobiales bacterium]